MILCAFTGQSQTNPWEQIELTGYHMKPGYSGVSWQQNQYFPWLIPVGGVAVGGGAVAYLLLREDDSTDELPELIARDDAITISCDSIGALNVLLNDEGEGLFVSSIEQVPVAIITENNGTLTIEQLMTVESFVFEISIEDRFGQMASSRVSVTVEAPEVSSLPDSLETPFNTPLKSNVLSNDSGPVLTVIDHGTPAEGTATIMPDGALAFTPATNFQGTVNFSYTVEGPCGLQSESQVVITVLPADCDYTASFETTPADCGLANGIITATVDLPGNYTFNWENGQEGPVLENAAAGTYELTVMEVDLDCELAFTAELSELPADYISNINVIDAVCPEPGDIQFEYSPAGTGPWLMIVIHPEGESQFEVEPGLIALSEYLPMEPGAYAVNLIDESAGADCTGGFEAELTEVSPLTIELVDVIPPSDPEASDGAMIIRVVVPTLSPYNIEVNGSDWGVAFTEEFVMEGFGVGEYTVQLDDALGCLSNTLVVDIMPPSGLQLAFGQALVNMPEGATVEHPSNREQGLQPLLSATASFGKQHQHQLEMGIATPRYFYQNTRAVSTTLRLAYYKKLITVQPAGFNMQLQGGVQAVWLDNQVLNAFSLRTQLWKHVFRGLVVQMQAGADICQQKLFPSIGFGIGGGIQMVK